ncbi:NAD(P)-dependent oxidoreductase [Kribbella solani]|uniref:Putative NADH-flavin reductase n=1 Tax=Kribbella solani TaxID=236067 RepID=A0A841DZX0_9ACTN|nr:NAD(P)H-binding protein [Kribbella solani]MBB5982300.1 putative NADH-flavin reductase [Kribbella solani]
MKLVVFGASGRIGTELVRQAVAAGHTVTAVVRAGSSLQVALPELRLVAAQAGVPGGQVEVVTADVLDPAAIAPVLAGHDGVLSALGPRPSGPSDLLTESARSMLRALDESGVRRFLVVSVAGIHTKGDDPFTKYVVKPILGRFLRESFADARRMEELVTASTADWTIVCPPRLTNGAGKGRIRSNTEGTVRGGFTITRADVATYLLDVVADPGLHRKTAIIANGSGR